VAERLEVMAREAGLTKSALCAYVVGNHVRMTDRMTVELLETVKVQLGAAMSLKDRSEVDGVLKTLGKLEPESHSEAALDMSK